MFGRNLVDFCLSNVAIILNGRAFADKESGPQLARINQLLIMLFVLLLVSHFCQVSKLRNFVLCFLMHITELSFLSNIDQ